MGENGAGKSTLLKCLFGIYQKTPAPFYSRVKRSISILPKSTGKWYFDGTPGVKPGITTFVMDNMWLGRYPTKGMFVDQEKCTVKPKRFLMNWILISIRGARRHIIRFANADDRNRQSVSYNAKIVIMDEPTSSLTEKELIICSLLSVN